MDLPCSWHTKASLFCNYYTKYIFSHLKNDFNYAFNIARMRQNTNYSHQNSHIIWMFWWQGENKMPLIVKKCYLSVKKHANGHKVILITKNNIKKYATIPEYIYHRLYIKDITLTHFSDVLRFNLLNNYGGLWIDSTMYCTSNLTNKYFGHLYTCGDYNIEQSHNFACKWTEFLIGGDSHSLIFGFINEFFKLYWKNHDCSIDYFEADYALKYAYSLNISHFKEYVDTIAQKNNPHLYYLLDYLDEEYDNNKYINIIKDSNLFKLTYKKNFIKSKNGKKTFFYELINDKL